MYICITYAQQVGSLVQHKAYKNWPYPRSSINCDSLYFAQFNHEIINLPRPNGLLSSRLTRLEPFLSREDHVSNSTCRRHEKTNSPPQLTLSSITPLLSKRYCSPTSLMTRSCYLRVIRREERSCLASLCSGWDHLSIFHSHVRTLRVYSSHSLAFLLSRSVSLSPRV